MKNLKQNEAISLFAALLVVGFVFFGSYANPFKQSPKEEKPTGQGAVTLVDSKTQPATAAEALKLATNTSGEVTKLIIEDVSSNSTIQLKKRCSKGQ